MILPDSFKISIWQARRDSNPQHPVLETGALPVRATGLHFVKKTSKHYTPRKLLRLSVHRVMTAPGAKFLSLQALCRLLFVFSRRIVSFFAVGTLQRNDVAHIVLGNDLVYGSCTDCSSAFSDRESQSLFQCHRCDQLDIQVHIVSRHHHLDPFR